ncbi:hypothetical protein L9F63_006399, partial [Diploptera punctata]
PFRGVVDQHNYGETFVKSSKSIFYKAKRRVSKIRKLPCGLLLTPNNDHIMRIHLCISSRLGNLDLISQMLNV